MEVEIYWEVDTIAFRFYWTIIRTMRGDISDDKNAFLNTHRWLNIANITPHGPDDGSVEPKRYSVDFSINLSFHLDYLVINFSTYVIYIYIYIYIIFLYKRKEEKNHFLGAIMNLFLVVKTIIQCITEFFYLDVHILLQARMGFEKNLFLFFLIKIILHLR